jgi:hypothetical protein
MNKQSFSIAIAAILLFLGGVARHAAAQQTFSAEDLRADIKALTQNNHRISGYEDGSLAAAEHLIARLKEMGYTYQPTDEDIEAVFQQRLAELPAPPEEKWAEKSEEEKDALRAEFREKQKQDLRKELFHQASIYTQDFSVVQPRMTECQLLVGEKTYGMADGFHPCRPNILLASITPEEGLSGECVYIGSGTLPEYGKRSVQGRIAVVDFDSEMNWLNAFAMGARAVIFIGSQDAASSWVHHVNIPANLPRFYVTPELADTLNLRQPGVRVTIKAAAEWKTLHGRNVILRVPGTKWTDQAVVLAAPLDSYGPVPTLSPNARDAANVALLLQLAEKLKANPPRRSVIFLFADGQYQNHMGARTFYGTLLRSIANAKYSLADLRNSYEEELVYVRRLLAILEQDNIYEIPSDGLKPFSQSELQSVHKEAIRFLMQEAKLQNGGILDDLRPLRILIADLEQRKRTMKRLFREGKLEINEETFDKAIDTITAEQNSVRPLIAKLSVEDFAWNTLQKILHNEYSAHDPDIMQKLFSEIPNEQVWIRDPKTEEIRKTDYFVNTAAGLPEQETRQERLERITPNRFDRLVNICLDNLRKRETELRASLRSNEHDQLLADILGPEGKNKTRISVHFSVNLSGGSSQWSFLHGDDSDKIGEDTIGNYTALLNILDRVREERQNFNELHHFNRKPISQDYADVRIFAPGKFIDSGPIPRMFGIYNMSLMTTLDRMPRQGQPVDTLDRLDLETFSQQGNEAVLFLQKLLAEEGLDFKPRKLDVLYADKTFNGQTTFGGSIKRAGGGSAIADFPARDALVFILSNRTDTGNLNPLNCPPGFNYPIVLPTDANGVFDPPVVGKQAFRKPSLYSAIFNPVDRGLVSMINNTKSRAANEGLAKAAVELVSVDSITLVGYGYDRGGVVSLAMMAKSTSPFREDRYLMTEWEDVLTLFAPKFTRGYKIFNPSGMVLLGNEKTEEEYKGRGFALNDPFEHPLTAMITEDNLRVLNQYRLELLRKRRINQASLEVLMGVSEDTAEDAYLAVSLPDNTVDAVTELVRETAPSPQLPSELQDMTLDEFVGKLGMSTAFSRSTYTPLRGTMEDLVTAVVLLLLLSMPFAFSLERLLIGTPHIYRQISWFIFFFLVTFGILFLVNPAFKIAATPVIIFLAFAIILLSSLVIFIMIRKLQSEVKKMQGLSTTVHSADVSRLSTMMAAVNMGISTMRRRPLRTILTATTVILLTFTILTFASFGSEWGVRRTNEGPMNSTTARIMVRHQLWSPIDEDIFGVLRGYLTKSAEVVPRYWLAPTASDIEIAKENNRTYEMALTRAAKDRILTLDAGIGLDPRDLFVNTPAGEEQAPRLRDLHKLLDGDVSLLARDGLFLNRVVADELDLTSEDVGKVKLTLAGVEFTYAGVLTESLSTYTMLENSSITPVDYQSSGGDQEGAFGGKQQPAELQVEQPDVANASFINYNYERVALMSADRARTMGATIRSIHVYPLQLEEIESIANKVATETELPTYIGYRGGVERLIFTSLTKASGWRDLLVPVLLGGLIIFATLLGSVSDREKEIYTFSSLGLAPPHVASLFFAEASVYAVVGGMGGYLLGQIVAVTLGWLGSMGWISVPSMNYSSTNAIVTILIVMATVLISTIYPAMKASRSANPGIQRQWKIPKPQNNLYDLVFPFTVSAYDITGVVSFLREHFENYSDTSIGCFATTSCSIFRQESNDMLGFEADVALAPFDLGVNQKFAMLSQPSDIEGIDEVRILICRTSGTSGDWQRSNRLFVNDLRKQLLIWRSLPMEVMEQYREKTLEQWDSLPRKTIDPDTFGRDDAQADTQQSKEAQA